MKPSSQPSSVSTAAGWYFARDGRKGGPVTFQQLQQFAAAGKLLPTDQILRPGGAAWETAASLPGLFGPKKSPTTIQAKAPAGKTALRRAPAEPQAVDRHLPMI